MNKTNINNFLKKTSRISAWILLFLIILYFITGYSMTGKYSANKIIGTTLAIKIHTSFCWIIIIAFILHSGVEVYFAMRRWGWIK